MAGADFDQQGVEIALTPLQLAAILEQETVSTADCTSARFWGAAELVGGALELVGGAALLLVPEPTMVTKIAGGTLTAHGIDTSGTALLHITSCQTRSTLTSQAVAAGAKALGASPERAATVALAVEIAVPLLAGLAGTARVLAVRRGAVQLIEHEGPTAGHTLARHVGKTEAELQARLAMQKGIKAASSFSTLREAERAVSDAVYANRDIIKAWAKDAGLGERRAFTYEARQVVGQGVLRSTGRLTPMSKVTVVLEKVIQKNRVYFILTAFPSL